jgi:hypothetical protein
MTKADGSHIEDLFSAVITGNVELDKHTLKPYRDLVFRVDIEKCTDTIAEKGIESFRNLLIENFTVHVDSLVNGKVIP